MNSNDLTGRDLDCVLEVLFLTHTINVLVAMLARIFVFIDIERISSDDLPSGHGQLLDTRSGTNTIRIIIIHKGGVVSTRNNKK